ncbi:MAG TPA: hypothetical protein PKD61_15630 [Polyangiaceae bacterium]|nr:hypothetical protein [Polyangiaceae bacterium]
MRRLVGVLALLAAVPSACIVQVGDPDDGASGGAGSTTPACGAEDLTAAERQMIYQQARSNLEAKGAVFDAGVWTDPARFSEFVEEVYVLAGCAPPGESAPQALHSDDGPDFYCGPGHGLAKLKTPAVSQCMNELCKLHDACYSMCSGPTKGCSWLTNTTPCDEPFLEQIRQCPAEPGTLLASGAVEFLANVVDLAGSLFSCGEMTCPKLGELGNGVCSAEPTGEDCSNCLSATDPGSLCLDAACPGPTHDALCSAANCPEVSECYGGYDRGVPGGVQPTQPITDPDTVLWDLVVHRGEMPSKKSNGDDWDVGLFGWSPPDPFVIATVGTETGISSSPQDVFKPLWKDTVLSGLTAQSLRNGISFEVWDEDISDHDRIGSCHRGLVNEDFSKTVLMAPCDTPGLVVYFYVVPRP